MPPPRIRGTAPARTLTRVALAAIALVAPVLATPAAMTPSVGAAPAPASICDRLGAPEVVGEVGTDQLDELSGIGASMTLDGVLWAHNDSGDSARLFAMDEQGHDLGTYDVVDAAGDPVSATDWEDLAVVRDPADGTGRIYVADIGDNAAARSDGVTLYRIAEPAATPDGSGGTLTVDGTLVVHYPDGPTDAEALLVDPVDATAVIVTKDVLGSSLVLTVPATAWVAGATADVDATVAGHLELGLAELAGAGALDTARLPGTLVTAADTSPDGSLVVVRTYQALVLVERTAGTTLADALLGPHCMVAGPVEPQGEAVTITADGAAILTATEVQGAVNDGRLPDGSTSPITRLDLAPPAAPPLDTAAPATAVPATDAATSTEHEPDTVVPIVATAPATTEPAPIPPTTTEGQGGDDRPAAYVVAAVGAVVAAGVIGFALRPRRSRRGDPPPDE